MSVRLSHIGVLLTNFGMTSHQKLQFGECSFVARFNDEGDRATYYARKTKITAINSPDIRAVRVAGKRNSRSLQ